ncbi:hypothetical protein NE237_030497 [Protea cynaroides]|uniref:WRKY domain-containing protein n=1 Tax=Protea cynaroides TaxID=273540 RepID=A0A9Q0GWA8_9MAGN|nr:hypothetical protein NE237_030497 [Protea cynaroides]
MASFCFQPKNFLGNPSPNYNDLMMDYPVPSPGFKLSDFLAPETGSEDDSVANPILPENISYDHQIGDIGNVSTSTEIKCKRGVKKIEMDLGFRVAFRTKSELEIMDDGFKWRKYGKKSVKNSPNPRNYYRCANGGCYVKKRVERDREDSSYVITTYEVLPQRLREGTNAERPDRFFAGASFTVSAMQELRGSALADQHDRHGTSCGSAGFHQIPYNANTEPARSFFDS